MEQTLGKRISASRKNLGWTQDQLAERLGVTAQAVSKWENDQSCPDITMLPKLADLFNTTTDALLGIAPMEPIRKAEPVQEEEPDSGSIEISIDSSRRGGILFGCWILLCGLLQLCATWLVWDLDLWTIIWTTWLMVFGLQGLFKHSIFLGLGSFFAGAYFLLIRIVSLPFDITSYVIPALLILYGISVVIHSIAKPNRPLFVITQNGKAMDHDHPQADYHSGEDSFSFSGSFGDLQRQVDIPQLRQGEIVTSFGDFTLDLSGVEALAPNARIEASCSFGNLTLLVPQRFRVVSSAASSFANAETKGSPAGDAQGILHLEGSVNFGQILIRYI